VIHAAAVANVDLCFTDRELGQRVNVLGTENVARAAAEVGARLVSVSTDLVFDGRQSMVHEEVRPEPICAYGETKLEAERRALALCPVAVVARSALLMGFGLGGRRTFFETSLETIRGGGRVRLFTDEHRTPISVLDAAGALLELARRPELGGIFHLAGPERVSRYELGLRMARAFGLPEERVIPISVADITFPDARPRDVSLSSERAQRELETKIPPLDEALRALLA
jgi:dTDP-4-dehydrorhamnose reductase